MYSANHHNLTSSSISKRLGLDLFTLSCSSMSYYHQKFQGWIGNYVLWYTVSNIQKCGDPKNCQCLVSGSYLLVTWLINSCWCSSIPASAHQCLSILVSACHLLINSHHHLSLLISLSILFRHVNAHQTTCKCVSISIYLEKRKEKTCQKKLPRCPFTQCMALLLPKLQLEQQVCQQQQELMSNVSCFFFF